MTSQRDGPRMDAAFSTDEATSTSANSSDSIFRTAKDCDDIRNQGYTKNGIYKIKPKPTCTSKLSFRAVCDLESSCDGWTVIHRRYDGSVNFYRNWKDYENGFGSLTGEHWLGLEKIHRMTATGDWILRIELEDFYGNASYVEYTNFSIGDKSTYYRLSFGEYRGIAGDSLKYEPDAPFSTYDQDHDIGSRNCAALYLTAGWYANCDAYSPYANLNGPYYNSPTSSWKAMIWYYWKNKTEALKKSEMKIRRVGW